MASTHAVFVTRNKRDVAAPWFAYGLRLMIAAIGSKRNVQEDARWLDEEVVEEPRMPG